MGYFCRFLISFLTLVFVLHFRYVVAIKDSQAWSGDTPFEISMVGFWNLIVVSTCLAEGTLVSVITDPSYVS
jgi:D-alanyl-lipoteichoic acid acyltransferase DltB (MBOAT superfamily)